MKILKKLLVVLAISVVALILGRVVVAQWFLITQANKLMEDMRWTYWLSWNPAYTKDCLSDGRDVGPDIVSDYQLRFVNESEYVVEVRCSGLGDETHVIEQKQLTGGVTKEAGYPGATFSVKEKNSVETSVVLTLWGFRRAVLWQNNEAFSKLLPVKDGVDIGDGYVKTTCEGWGYSCCDQRTQVGKGDKNIEGFECLGGCYEVCLSRPVIVFFNSDPSDDPRSRKLEIYGKDAAVVFSYLVQDFDGETVEIEIDFGDSERFVSDNYQGTVTHEYKCESVECNFEVSLRAVDSDGIEAVEARISKLIVVQRGQ